MCTVLNVQDTNTCKMYFEVVCELQFVFNTQLLLFLNEDNAFISYIKNELIVCHYFLRFVLDHSNEDYRSNSGAIMSRSRGNRVTSRWHCSQFSPGSSGMPLERKWPHAFVLALVVVHFLNGLGQMMDLGRGGSPGTGQPWFTVPLESSIAVQANPRLFVNSFVRLSKSRHYSACFLFFMPRISLHSSCCSPLDLALLAGWGIVGQVWQAVGRPRDEGGGRVPREL